ncbi:DNA photolyase family protein [Membranicola marinus]|uniref:DNA photolyase family protein n=1 Tax=Membranihabitans marinus TaxID=1227546 RepID=A0A953I0Q7_9BACT|nr:DNA photolyase family protein [Membranihabitans marinus]
MNNLFNYFAQYINKFPLYFVTYSTRQTLSTVQKDHHVIHWFRRDLRLHDNKALHFALESGTPVKCIFIFDRNILDNLPEEDRRITFIHRQLSRIKEQLQAYESDLEIYHGEPIDIWKSLAETHGLKEVYTNRDYEPYAIQRDKDVDAILNKKKIPLHTFKDHLIFEKKEILTQQETPYKVFTPYCRAWKESLDADPENIQYNKHLIPYPLNLKGRLLKIKDPQAMPSLKSMGFAEAKIHHYPTDLRNTDMSDYDKMRNLPAKDGTSRLGTALRFGTISIRETMKMAIKTNETFWNELIWREFFSQILYNFPHVVNEPFHKKYANIAWRNNEEEFERWCQGETGYALVDAGMRELNKTGFMHNRVRMVTASFLVKDLLIDWRWGEAYFAEKLMDYELASNNGNWQWAAGCGTDAAPYFRIFNPESQQKKFDPESIYIKKWVKEWDTEDYTAPIVDHKKARQRCLKAYKAVV